MEQINKSLKYFLIKPKRIKEVASAFATQPLGLSSNLIPMLEGKYKMPCAFKLIGLKETRQGLIKSSNLNGLKNIWLDWLPNELAWPFFSEQLKTMIEGEFLGDERLDWISCDVEHDGTKRIYYIPRFNQKVDVLDEVLTEYIPETDSILIPCYSLAKIGQRAIFPKPLFHDLWRISSFLQVSENIKKAVEKAKLKGLVFKEVLSC